MQAESGCQQVPADLSRCQGASVGKPDPGRARAGGSVSAWQTAPSSGLDDCPAHTGRLAQCFVHSLLLVPRPEAPFHLSFHLVHSFVP